MATVSKNEDLWLSSQSKNYKIWMIGGLSIKATWVAFAYGGSVSMTEINHVYGGWEKGEEMHKYQTPSYIYIGRIFNCTEMVKKEK